MSRKVQRFGWSPDLPDHRDHMLSLKAPAKALPTSVDLRAKMPPVYDQGQLGSCTANAICAAFEFELARQNKAKDFMPSRLFVYYNERVIEGTVRSDAGAMIRDGIKSVVKQGVCKESRWPYVITKFARKPTVSCYTEALKFQALTYQRLTSTNIDELRGCLAAGFPFVFGFSVFDAFESAEVAQSGVLNLPTASESLVGGHAVLAVGYDDATKRVLVRNSWGPGWGQAGYFTMPYAYLTNLKLADDFWAIQAVEEGV
jgi:C1A family cysteine protease